jgi:hypothetical protein
MLYLQEYHRYRQDYLSQDRRHQFLADHPLLICSDQYSERCSPRVRSTSGSDALDHHYQTLFFLAKMSSLNRVGESESVDVFVVIKEQTRAREREKRQKWLNAITEQFKCVVEQKQTCVGRQEKESVFAFFSSHRRKHFSQRTSNDCEVDERMFDGQTNVTATRTTVDAERQVCLRVAVRFDLFLLR